MQRLDLLVKKTVRLELKAEPEIKALHLAQLLSYLKVSACSAGLLLNFIAKSIQIKPIYD